MGQKASLREGSGKFVSAYMRACVHVHAFLFSFVRIVKHWKSGTVPDHFKPCLYLHHSFHIIDWNFILKACLLFINFPCLITAVCQLIKVYLQLKLLNSFHDLTCMWMNFVYDWALCCSWSSSCQTDVHKAGSSTSTGTKLACTTGWFQHHPQGAQKLV